MKIYTTNIQTAPDYSSTTAIMLVIFWIEHDFCIIYDCKNSFNKKLKNLSEEYLKEKRQNVYWLCSLFTWFNMSIPNLCHR